MRFVWILAAIAISVLAPLAAQGDTTGSVRGYVVPGGYRGRGYVEDLIPQIIVTYSSPVNVFTAHTDSKGFYTIFGMPPGKYTIYATTPDLGYDLLLSSYHVCIHAGENLYRNLTVGFRDLPLRSAIERFDYLDQFRPDASETADVYGLGDC
jgi:hypothetical protein